MTPWIKFDEKRPTAADKYQDFIVLIDNPLYAKRKFYNKRPLKYTQVLASWDGYHFHSFDYETLGAVYYMPIPEMPTV